MIGKLETLVAKFRELKRELSAPEIFQDQEHYKKVAKKHAELGGIVPEIETYKGLLREIEENKYAILCNVRRRGLNEKTTVTLGSIESKELLCLMEDS